MISGEFTAGLHRLGILHMPTLPRSPHVNGKQENLWSRVESRLLAMLEGEATLSLEQLNLATRAWITQEYHRTVHREIDCTPLERFLAGPNEEFYTRFQNHYFAQMHRYYHERPDTTQMNLPPTDPPF